MNIKEISNKITKAIKRISDTKSSIWNTAERNICHHIASELEQDFPEYNIDIELDKDDRRRPDIVIHKRGNNEDNLIVFQVKKNPSTKSIEDDIKKINETFFRKPYLYTFGVFISIGKLPRQLPKFDPNKICIVEVYGWKITSTN